MLRLFGGGGEGRGVLVIFLFTTGAYYSTTGFFLSNRLYTHYYTVIVNVVLQAKVGCS